MPLQVFCRNCAQYRNEWCKLKVDSPDPDMMRDCQYYRGMTNADSIRSMTDEELAKLIADDWCELINCESVLFCNGIGVCNGDCEERVLKWLKQEVKGE